MKSIFVIAFFLLSFTTAKAQLMLGATKAHVKEQFAGRPIVDTTTDGVQYLHIKARPGDMFEKMYYFDKTTKLCYMYVVIPLSKEAWSAYVESNNRKLVPDDNSGTKWTTFQRDTDGENMITISVVAKFTPQYEWPLFYHIRKTIKSNNDNSKM